MEPFAIIMDLAATLCRGGEDTLFCPRCTGVWAGAALAVPVLWLARLPTPMPLCLLLTVFFLQMPVCGFGEIALAPAGKIASGQLFALGAVFGLAACPAKRWLKAGSRAGKGPFIPFLVAAGAGIAVLQIVFFAGTPICNTIVDILSLVGLAAAGLLAPFTLAAVLLPRREKTESSHRERKSGYHDGT